ITDELWPANFNAIGLCADDRLFFPFSFGPFLGFWAAFEGATRQGRFVLAGGGMTSAARLQLIAEHSITIVFCTPTYALRLAEVAAEERFDLAGSTVRAVVLAGEPGGNVPATRARIEAAWGARAFDHSGMTEIGALGIEYEDVPGRLFLLEDHCIAEFINPADGTPAAEGELAELVLTNLGRWDSPLLRYRTGDLVRWRRDVKPAAAPWPYVSLEGGILARADDMLWVKGNNVYPSAIEEVLRGIAEVAEYRLEVRGPQAAADLTIIVEPAAGAEADPLLERVARSVQDKLYFRPTVKAATAGSLPRFEMKAQRVVRIDG
ncbi:MAG TPA: phenylacetate--CoA ligase family protein, partial [Planctomycetia bacterium]|nr:phenylacetate--CoA ligase family protein [Planctomycetia bacterium]